MKKLTRTGRLPVTLTIEQTVSMAETHLNDLQAEVESEHRTLKQLREAAFSEQVRQADGAGRLAGCLAEIRASVAEQLERLRELRSEIRHVRDLIKQRSGNLWR